MKVPKRLAILGFNLCASVFLGFCVYGLLVHVETDVPRHFSAQVWALLALGVVGCIVGIGYFGRQWDLRKIEEARNARTGDGPKPNRRK